MAAGKDVEAVVYPDQPHGFGWYGGLGPTPSEGKEEAARTFFADMHAFSAAISPRSRNLWTTRWWNTCQFAMRYNDALVDATTRRFKRESRLRSRTRFWRTTSARMHFHLVLYPKRRTSAPGRDHKVYPYLLTGVSVERANQVWATDICYLPMAKGFMYLVAVMDWLSRRVLSWRVSNTLDREFCVEALEEALARYGAPEIFNTDQGAQFTSEAFTDVLKAHGVAISMDGKGRWIDNVFIERLWRSVKYEDIYLRAYETPAALRAGLTRYFDFYNTRRRHTALDRRTPDAVYFEQVAVNTAA